MNAKPKPWSILRSEEGGQSIVVPSLDTPVNEAIAAMIEEDYGFAVPADHPLILKEIEREKIRVERWTSCSKALCESEGFDYESYASWWMPGGDGKRFIYVVNMEKDAYAFGEEIDIEMNGHES